MPDSQAMEGTGAAGEVLLTLTEVSKRTGISMPTLQRYKRMYQARIPSVGRGRKQRYPASALSVFEELKTENLGRRGRPRKSGGAKPSAAKPAGRAAKPTKTARAGKAAKAATPKAAKPAKTAKAAKPAARGKKAAVVSGRKAARPAAAGLLTLTEISERTGISYPTLVRYVKMNLKAIPHEGEGRKRRYLAEAIEVFKRMRAEGRASKGAAKPRGRAAGGRKASARGKAPQGIVETVARGAEKRIKSLEKSIKGLEKKLSTLLDKLSKPRRMI